MELDERLLCMVAQGFTFPDILAYHGKGKTYLRARMRELYRMCKISTDDSRDLSLSRIRLTKEIGKRYTWALTRRIDLNLIADQTVEDLLLSGATPGDIGGVLGVGTMKARAKIASVYGKYGISRVAGGNCRRRLIERANAEGQNQDVQAIDTANKETDG